MYDVFNEELMKSCIQLGNHDGLESLLKSPYFPKSAIKIGLEASAKYSEDQCMRLLLAYCYKHKGIQVEWDKLIKLATDVDPDEAGSGGHPLLGLYIRSVRQSRGALAEKPLASFLFQGVP